MDDPKKPWKAIVAALVAGLTALLAFAEVLPLWALMLISVLLAGLSTYHVPNPKIGS